MISLLPGKVQQLGGLDLAVLVSILAAEHCIFSSEPRTTQELRDELHLICSETFNLRTNVIECDAGTSITSFGDDLVADTPSGLHLNANGELLENGAQTPGERAIPEAVILDGLDRASEAVQMQCMELLRTRRTNTPSGAYALPDNFLVLAILSRPGVRLSRHLNDMFAMSHHHKRGDGFLHLESKKQNANLPGFLPTELQNLREYTRSVTTAPEIAAYLHNIVVFMRMSRYIKGGVTARATRNLRSVVQALALLHGLDFVPPSIVVLAAKKIYPHRLILAKPETEISLLWGSDPDAVADELEGVTIEDAIEDAIAAVDTPL